VAILGWLALGPLIIVLTLLAVGIADVLGVLLAVLFGLVVLAVSVAYLLWSGSAHLYLHEHGMVVGRSFLGGAPRAMRFAEIDPSTIRVFTGAHTLLPIWQVRIRRPSSVHLFLFPRADRAVTFLGPDQDSALSGMQRPVTPRARDRRVRLAAGRGDRTPAAHRPGARRVSPAAGPLVGRFRGA